MFNKRKLSVTVCLLLILLPGVAAPENEESERKAVDASLEWLSLIDNGQYEESWDRASALFRNAIARDQWKQSLSAVRGPLGKMIKRSLKSRQFATSLPGAPDGQYVVIQYETSFENKRFAIETITPMRDKDGAWRISGYYIR